MKMKTKKNNENIRGSDYEERRIKTAICKRGANARCAVNPQRDYFNL